VGDAPGSVGVVTSAGGATIGHVSSGDAYGSSRAAPPARPPSGGASARSAAPTPARCSAPRIGAAFLKDVLQPAFSISKPLRMMTVTIVPWAMTRLALEHRARPIASSTATTSISWKQIFTGVSGAAHRAMANIVAQHRPAAQKVRINVIEPAMKAAARTKREKYKNNTAREF